MLERVIALALLIFGLVWAASVMGTPDAPAPSPEAPDLPDAPPVEPQPEPEPEPRPRSPPRSSPPPRSGILGGLLGPPK